LIWISCHGPPFFETLKFTRQKGPAERKNTPSV
jgi:hypothetical protein